jgi:four helix bundle protein
MMHADDLKQRTKQFSIDVFRLIESLPSKRSIDIIGRQLIRAASSVGANYRTACRARSKADFISKITIVEE